MRVRVRAVRTSAMSRLPASTVSPRLSDAAQTVQTESCQARGKVAVEERVHARACVGACVRARGVHSAHNPLSLTVNHRQPGFVEETHPSVLEEPDGEDGERQQQDERQQIDAVLSVTFLSLLLGGQLLHSAVLRRQSWHRAQQNHPKGQHRVRRG